MDTVIFDLDDTLVDTWGATKKANRSLFCFFLKNRLFKLTKALVFRENEEYIAYSEELLLLDAQKVIRAFMRMYYPKISNDTIERAFKAFNKTFYENFHLIEGAKEVLDYLSEKYSLCLVTDGTKEWQDNKLDYFKLREYFDKIIISGEIGTSKLNPQNFKLALKGTEDTVYVVGDRLEIDIKGGKAIGAKTIHFRNGFFKSDVIDDIVPDYSITNLKQLKQIL